MFIPKIIESAIYTDDGMLGQIKGPTTKGRTKLTTSNSFPFLSPNSNTTLSVTVLDTKQEELTWLLRQISRSLQVSSSAISRPSWLLNSTEAALEVQITFLTVFERRHALRIPRVPSTARLVTVSSGSSPRTSMGWATWNTPTQPSMADEKLLGWLRSALKSLSLFDAPGRVVRQLRSLLQYSVNYELMIMYALH